MATSLDELSDDEPLSQLPSRLRSDQDGNGLSEGERCAACGGLPGACH